jgi:hypothetical protein
VLQDLVSVNGSGPVMVADLATRTTLFDQTRSPMTTVSWAATDYDAPITPNTPLLFDEGGAR